MKNELIMYHKNYFKNFSKNFSPDNDLSSKLIENK